MGATPLADSIPILWPNGIEVEVVPPLVILRAQIEPLRRSTGGLVEAAISHVTVGDYIRHNLDLVAPALSGYRQRILSVTQHSDYVYPVKVEAEFEMPKWIVKPTGKKKTTTPSDLLTAMKLPLFTPKPITSYSEDYSPGESWTPNAPSQKEFVQLLGDVLGSADVRGLIQSLIARSRDVQNQKNGQSDEQEELPSQAD